MKDIKLSKREDGSGVESAENSTRRNFLKVAALGGAALFLQTASKKVNDVMPSEVAASKEKKTMSTKGGSMVFTEDDKEFTVYDKNGESLFIFEKEA